MTDRELLEAAAKAAGLRIVDRSAPVTFYIESDGCKGGIPWNPLAFDGDAVRLAVQLRISVIHEEECLGGRTIHTIEAISPERADGSRHCEMHSLDDESDTDPMAIVRRCIVRAAAAIEAETKGRP